MKAIFLCLIGGSCLIEAVQPEHNLSKEHQRIAVSAAQALKECGYVYPGGAPYDRPQTPPAHSHSHNDISRDSFYFPPSSPGPKRAQ